MSLATRLALVLTVLVALAFAWYYGGGRWRERVDDRLLYGIPWGTLVVVSINVGFYLFVQGGLWNWVDPVVFPFVSWSYFYPVGLLTSGIAHGGPNHLLSNMTATLALAPIAEYAWSHFPPGKQGRKLGGDLGRLDVGRPSGLLGRPWVRAVVVFPLVLVAGGVVGSLFSLGPGIGFSGVVFAIAGFALVTAPLPTVVAVVVTSALSRLISALTQPIIRAGVEGGPPSPPAWANIGFQVHMLGFLVGVIVGAVVLLRRRQRPKREWAFFAAVLFGLAQSLWLVVWPGGDDTYVLYQGAGVAFVLLLSIVVAVAASGPNGRIPQVFDDDRQVPERRILALLWLLLLAVLAAGSLAGARQLDQPFLAVAGPAVVLALVLSIPALPALAPDRWYGGPVTQRHAGLVGLVMLTLLVASVGIPLGFVTADDSTIESASTVQTGDYTLAYVENGTTGHSLAIDLYEDEELRSNVSGVVLVSEQREMWTVAIPERALAYRGNASVQVGGLGWRETVDAERTGWDVVGNDSAYVVDLVVDGERTRSYTGDPVRAGARINEHNISVVPTADGFDLRIERNGTRLGTGPLPKTGESTTVGPLTFTTEEDDDTHVVARSDGTEVTIATKE